ncbi:hypothetical protein LIPSTDRAFT_275533 [Lipomyces starkeyi NRRL Y-11557]|uniref:Uncharacterized protein n=1 Tax=Lipomyces starkeyi NRRL Y-11557 TaxID=675824 RepID=A0A1E3Q9T8_LIPST|nr:hypothetical protein LIPSTDRAFT_275533 [Lipomyces starkeyi NRRL Y-11557]
MALPIPKSISKLERNVFTDIKKQPPTRLQPGLTRFNYNSKNISTNSAIQYNKDETGFAVGDTQSTRTIVNSTQKSN